MPETEEWRPIPGYENLYEASDLGRIRRVGGFSMRGDGVQKGTPSPSGIRRVTLAMSPRSKRQFAVRDLVMAAFGLKVLDLRPHYGVSLVRHKDGDTSNNRLLNLESRQSPREIMESAGKRQCRKCGTTKALSEFNKHTSGAPGSQCKRCAREFHLQKEYGISADDWDRMHREQNGVCLLCGQRADDPLVVDHDHKTGRVRGLVHNRCNVLLGRVEILTGRDGLELDDVLDRIRRYLLP